MFRSLDYLHFWHWLIFRHCITCDHFIITQRTCSVCCYTWTTAKAFVCWAIQFQMIHCLLKNHLFTSFSPLFNSSGMRQLQWTYRFHKKYVYHTNKETFHRTTDHEFRGHTWTANTNGAGFVCLRSWISSTYKHVLWGRHDVFYVIYLTEGNLEE